MAFILICSAKNIFFIYILFNFDIKKYILFYIFIYVGLTINNTPSLEGTYTFAYSFVENTSFTLS